MRRTKSLAAELDVIRAVAKRELKYYFRYPAWLLFDALMPLLWVLSLVIYGKALVGSQYSASLANLANTGDYISYTVVGMVLSSYAFSTLWGMSYALRGEQLGGTLEALFVTPCSRYSIMLGKSLFSMLTTTAWVSIQLTLSMWLFGVKLNMVNLPLALVFLMLCLPSLLGMGFSLAGIVLEFKEHNVFVNFLSSIMYLLLPITYPLVALPSLLRALSYLIPATYAMEGIRNVLTTEATWIDSLNLMLPLLFFDLLWIALGKLIYEVEERKVMKRGTLGYY